MPLPDDQRIDRAHALIEIGRYAEAIVELSSVAGRHSDNYYVLCSLSLCNYHLGNMREAQDLADQAIAVEPENEWAYRLRSLCLTARGLHDKALDAAREAVRKAPDEPFALRTLIGAQITFSNFDEAEGTAQLLLTLAPDQAESHELAGLLKLAQEDVSGAEKHFLRALEIDPQSATAHNNLGMVYLEQSQGPLLAYPGRGRKARDAFLSALKLQPTLAEARQNLQAAENNPAFFGGKGTRLFILIQTLILFAIISGNVAGRFLPYVINLFVSYRPIGLYLGMNIMLVVFLVFWLFGVIAMRRARLTFIESNFRNNFARRAMLISLMFVLQVVYGVFFICLDKGLSGIAWALFIVVSASVILSILKIFSYYDSQVPD